MTEETVAARRDLLTVVLDTLVPAADGFPGAGEVAVQHVLKMAAASVELDRLLARGLRAVEAATPTGCAAGFPSLDSDGREQVLRRLEGSHADFLEALVRHTYDGYYSHPAVLARLGLDPVPLHPRGHRVGTADVPDLARVIARGQIYRPA